MKQIFYEGEFVTALPNRRYVVTDNGWTGRVASAISDPDFEVEAYGRCDHVRRERSWCVLKRFFIPYSSNMETSAFKDFCICGGDDG